MSPSECNPRCLVCENSLHCFGRCAGVPAEQAVAECFQPAANRPGDLDPLTGSARESLAPAARETINMEFSPCSAAGPADASPTVPPAGFIREPNERELVIAG